MKFLFSVFILFASQNLFAAGFSSGNEFQSTLIQGRLTAICPAVQPGAPQQISYITCRATILDPAEFDYFVGPKVDGDKVELVSTREDGSTRSKSSGYDGEVGKSDKRFNLWISTLTQRPLLADGVNKVSYKITKGNAKITSGEFIATVTRQPTATCRPRTINFPFAQDCNNQLSACDRYFDLENYCQ